MTQRLGALVPIVAIVAALGWGVGRSRIEGDGYEYLLTAKAFASHASPDIRPADIDALRGLPKEALSRAAVGRVPLDHIADAVTRGETEIVDGVLRARDGSYYAIHFWLYSLLAAPLVGALASLGASPAFAFGLLNAAFALAALAYLARVLGPGIRARVGAALFLLGGILPFVPWSGPEVMTAASVLVACLAMWRRDVGVGLLAAGIAASQNPSAGLLVPALLVVFALQRVRPELRCAGAPARWRPRVDLPLALLGAVLAVLPPLFFWWKYGTPSVIAVRAADPSLVGPERLVSLFFDLNQGMCVGSPGPLFAGVLAIGVVAVRARGLCRAALPVAALGLVIAMAIPALVPHNWNAGTRAAMRYTVWLSMPLLAVALLALPLLERAKLGAFAALALALGLVPVGLFGAFGRSNAHLAHNPLAAFVLAHRPSLYNPLAEVFAERTLHREGAPSPEEIAVFREGGEPRKLMRSWLGSGAGGRCPAGRELDGALGALAGGSWQYVDAPFRCVPVGLSHRLGTFRFGAKLGGAGALLTDGWSRPETDGVWTDGPISHLRIPVPRGTEPVRLLWHGHYFGETDRSEVAINGVDIGARSLADGGITLPATLRPAEALDIELRHPDASSPLSRGESEDARLLGFFLVGLGMEGERRSPAPQTDLFTIF